MAAPGTSFAVAPANSGIQGMENLMWVRYLGRLLPVSRPSVRQEQLVQEEALTLWQSICLHAPNQPDVIHQAFSFDVAQQ
eukprot:scaffold5966_cov118-Cylindrotheca_fusiformis.AAC.21